MPPSSRGLGHFPFTEVTGIRIPLGVIKKFFTRIETGKKLFIINDKFFYVYFVNE